MLSRCLEDFHIQIEGRVQHDVAQMQGGMMPISLRPVWEPDRLRNGVFGSEQVSPAQLPEGFLRGKRDSEKAEEDAASREL